MKNYRLFASILVLCASLSCTRNEIELRLAHYNVGVFGKTEASSIDVIADMMKEIEADVVSLNELDSCTTRTGLVDQLAVMSEKMGDWGSHYASAMPYRGGAYGIGVTFNPKFKVVRQEKVPLPKFDGAEPRALAVVEFEDFIFATCHLDYTTEASQLGQVAVINEYADSVYREAEKPFFLCGDFNCEPGSAPISLMQQTWSLISATDLTYPADNPRKCIDYIFVRPGKSQVKVRESKVYTGFATGDVKTDSDHLPVFADVVIVRK